MIKFINDILFIKQYDLEVTCNAIQKKYSTPNRQMYF